jgi:hypothetical protein
LDLPGIFSQFQRLAMLAKPAGPTVLAVTATIVTKAANGCPVEPAWEAAQTLPAKLTTKYYLAGMARVGYLARDVNHV